MLDDIRLRDRNSRKRRKTHKKRRRKKLTQSRFPPSSGGRRTLENRQFTKDHKGLHPTPTASYLRKSASICGLSVFTFASLREIFLRLPFCVFCAFSRLFLFIAESNRSSVPQPEPLRAHDRPSAVAWTGRPRARGHLLPAGVVSP